MDGLRFAVLGPVRAWRDDAEIALGTPQQRTMLAVLLLRRGRTATVEELVDAIWGEDPPSRAITGIRTYASRLRATLEPDRAARQRATVMVSEAGGYALRVPAASFDMALFEQGLATADWRRRTGQRGAAAAALRQALDLWDGEPLAGINGPWAETQRVHLDEQRLAALETLFVIELEMGHAAESVAGLTELTSQHPLRERPRSLLMLALYRCGRQAEALGVYADTRRMLREELGLDPGPELTDLHRKILVGDSSLAETENHLIAEHSEESTASSTALPNTAYELPLDLADFTGRSANVADLVQVLSADDRRVMPVVSITGFAGIGKTALAVHVGHAIRHHYPDGQIFADLRGSGPDPARPEMVLAELLATLGVPGTALPKELPRRSALLRSTLAERRILVVFDDARDADQVHPLLPGSANCAVIVTSRSRLAGMHATRAVDLDVLVTDEAITLLGRIAGEQRVEDEREIAAEVVAACGHLPLAVRIVGSRLASRRSWSMATIAERLTDERRRLDEMRVGNHTVLATFELGYGQLDDEQARAFRLLALPDVHEVSLPVAAAVLDLPEHHAEDVLESLVDANLLETPAPDRYRYHDLLRLFARRQAERYDTDTTFVLVKQRLLDFYLASARNAYPLIEVDDGFLDRLSKPSTRGQGFTTGIEALDWLKHETVNLCAVITQAAQDEAPDLRIVADLLLSLEPIITSGAHLGTFEQTARLVATTALAKDDLVSQCRAGYILALVLFDGFRLEEAAEVLRKTAEQAELADEPVIHAEALNALGVIATEQRSYDTAYDLLSQAVATFRGLHVRGSEANALSNLGRTAAALGRHEQAAHATEEAVRLNREIGSTVGTAKALYNLGTTLYAAGRPNEAIAHFTECLKDFRATAQHRWEQHTLYRRAESHLYAGNTSKAITDAEDSLAVSRESGHRFGQGRALVLLGHAFTKFGAVDRARGCWEQALEIFVEITASAADDVRNLLDRMDADKVNSGNYIAKTPHVR